MLVAQIFFISVLVEETFLYIASCSIACKLFILEVLEMSSRGIPRFDQKPQIRAAALFISEGGIIS